MHTSSGEVWPHVLQFSLPYDVSHKKVWTSLYHLVSAEQKVLMVRLCVHVLKNALFMR